MRFGFKFPLSIFWCDLRLVAVTCYHSSFAFQIDILINDSRGFCKNKKIYMRTIYSLKYEANINIVNCPTNHIGNICYESKGKWGTVFSRQGIKVDRLLFLRTNSLHILVCLWWGLGGVSVWPQEEAGWLGRAWEGEESWKELGGAGLSPHLESSISGYLCVEKIAHWHFSFLGFWFILEPENIQVRANFGCSRADPLSWDEMTCSRLHSKLKNKGHSSPQAAHSRIWILFLSCVGGFGQYLWSFSSGARETNACFCPQPEIECPS